MVGTQLEVLVEGISDETDLLLQGRTYGQAPKIDGLTYINEGWAELGASSRLRSLTPVTMTLSRLL